MLNRRILRIKVFKTLYSSMVNGVTSLQEAESQLEMSCEATRDLYVYMLGIVSPLTGIAREKIESARKKFNPTEEDLNPNTKFADNGLARLLDSDPDFAKAFKKRNFSWDKYDVFLRKVYNSLVTKPYFEEYMNSGESSLKEDCRLFTKIFEEEFTEREDLERILEDMSVYWGEDLPYSLTYVCRTLEALGKGERWSLPPLYQSDMKKGESVESDKAFSRKLLQAAYTSYGKMSDMISSSVSNWEKDRLVQTDVCLIVLGMAEAVTFPTIPVKVTINEYVEIAKYFGTPKSRQFVNGLLDGQIRKLADDGKINKEGAGLM